MYQYILYGMTIYTDIDFPQLLPGNTVMEKTVTVSEGVIPDYILQETEKKYEFGEKVSWLRNTTCYLYMESGNHIIYKALKGADLMKLRSYILGWGMSMLALQRRELAMHCSAVADDRGAILICGESGCGKSTVTTAFLERGYRLMADDMALVENMTDGKTIAKPAFPYQKLCEDVAISRGYDLKQLIHINEIKGKYLVPYQGDFLINSEVIRGMIILRKSCDDDLKVRELLGLDRFYACVNNLFLRHLLCEKKYDPIIGSQCLKMASAVPMELIERPAEKDTLNQVIEAAMEFSSWVSEGVS